MARDRCPLDPPSGLAVLQAEAPVTRVTLWDGTTPWLFTRWDDFRTLLADHRVSADTTNPGFPHMSEGMKARQGRGKTFINADDPEHAEQRLKLTPDFLVKKIEKLRPRVQELVDELITDMLAGPRPADLVEALALPVPSLVICELLGVPYEDRGLFHRLSKAINDQALTAAESAAAMEELLAYLGLLIDRKSAQPTDDVLGHLVSGQLLPGTMTRDEVVKVARLLLVAGHDTTANMIALGTIALLEHPDQLARLRATTSPELVKSAVEELLRYLTVTHFGRRRVALEDFEYGGQPISRGDGLIFAAEIANRDPEAFPEPDDLDVARNPRHHVAFGFGPHQCLGQSLARLELQVVFGTLFQRVPTLALAAPADGLPYKREMAVYGVDELPVSW
jgi:cytochrome P450